MRKVKIIGLQNKKVKLSPYNPVWKKLYKKEEKLLHPIVEKYALDIQHIGSTSIPGVKAKPIIDITIGVKNLKDGEKFVKPLELLGYEYKHNAGIKGRHFFAKGNKTEKTHHVHIVKLGGKLWKNQIIFRDYLRKHKEAVREYNKLKEGLAKKYENDREKYTAQKNNFIKDILKKMDGQTRANIKIGAEVDIVLKKDQPTGKLTRGKVAEILTSSGFHYRGIKVRLEDGQVGRVQKIYPKFSRLPDGTEYQEGLI